MIHVRRSFACIALASTLAALGTGCTRGQEASTAGARSGPVVPAVARLDALVCGPSVPGYAGHVSHDGTAARASLGCAACHAPCAPPGQKVFFGELARAGGATPLWDPVTRTCSGVYCHGGAAVPPPAPVAWVYADPNRPRPREEACSTCHGYPPASHRPEDTSCRGCHPATVAADGSIDLAGGRHVDGRLDVSCTGCHDAPPATGAHLAHAFADAEGRGRYGDLATLEDRFPGAAPGDVTQGYSFGCGHCHPLDAARHFDGALDVELRDEAAPPGTLKARAALDASYDRPSGTCRGSYCHSSGQQAPAFAVSPPWTSGAGLGCDGCHGNPPAYASGGPGAPDANSHLNLADDGYEFGHFLGIPGVWHTTKHGGVGAAPITCQSCHFETADPANVAPGGFYYLDTTGRYQLPGGDPSRIAYGWTAQLDCTTCHTGAPDAPPRGAGRVLPLRHVNGTRDVAFDPRTALPAIAGLPPPPSTPVRPYWVAQAVSSVPWPGDAAWNGTTVSFDLAGASYDRATKTCTAVGCHLLDTPVWGRPYGWGPGGENCNLCHPM